MPTWLIILIAVVIVIFIISKMDGESTEDSAANAAMGGLYVGGCLLQIFLWGLGIALAIWLFGALFG